MKIHRKRLWIELIVAAVAIVSLLIYAIPRFLRAQLVDSITESDCVYSTGMWKWDGDSVKQTGPVIKSDAVLFFGPSITQGEIQFEVYIDLLSSAFEIYFGLNEPYDRRLYWDVGGITVGTIGFMDVLIESETEQTMTYRTMRDRYVLAPKKWYEVRLVVRDGGKTVEGYIDGELAQTYKPKTPVEGQFGVGVQRTVKAEFRDIRVVKDYRE